MLTGLMTAVLALGAVLGAFALGFLRKWSTFIKLIVGFVVASIGMACVTFSSELIIAMIGAGIIGGAQGMVVPSLSVWLLEQTDERARSRAVGLFQTLLYLSQFAAPQIARQIAVASSSSVSGMRLYFLLHS
jgi:MFS family permease